MEVGIYGLSQGCNVFFVVYQRGPCIIVVCLGSFFGQFLGDGHETSPSKEIEPQTTWDSPTMKHLPSEDGLSRSSAGCMRIPCDERIRRGGTAVSVASKAF